MDEFAQNQTSKRTLKSYLPVYVAVFVLIIVLILIYVVLVSDSSGNFTRSNDQVNLTNEPSLLEVKCFAYADIFPLEGEFGLRSTAYLGDQEEFCEIILVGTITEVSTENFKLALPTRVQPIIVGFSESTEIVPYNSVFTFTPDVYEMSTFEKLERFKEFPVGVTIKISEDEEYNAHLISVGGYEMKKAEIEELYPSLESTESNDL